MVIFVMYWLLFLYVEYFMLLDMLSLLHDFYYLRCAYSDGDGFHSHLTRYCDIY